MATMKRSGSKRTNRNKTSRSRRATTRKTVGSRRKVARRSTSRVGGRRIKSSTAYGSKMESPTSQSSSARKHRSLGSRIKHLFD